MTIARILKNPLFGFLLLGSVLFLLDSLAGSDRQSIVVSVAQQQRLATLWETQTGSVVTPEQLDSLAKKIYGYLMISFKNKNSLMACSMILR